MATQNPPTLCEISYDVEWFDSEQPRIFQHRSLFSAKSHNSGRPNCVGLAAGHADGLSGDSASVASAAPTFLTYYDYLKNYYWENPSPVNIGGALSSPSLPAKSHSTIAWYGAGQDDVPGRNDRTTLSLSSLSRAAYHGDADFPVDDRRAHGEPKLRWIDALNAWVPDRKQSNTQPFINIINTPPRVERYIASKEGLHRRSRHDEAYNRRLQRKSYSTPLYDPEAIRRSRTVRFEAPRSASTTPQPVVVPEQIEVPQPVWDDETTTLEGELFDFEPAQAREQQQEQVVVVRVREPTTSSDSTLEPVLVNEQPSSWLEELAKRQKQQTPPPPPPPPEPEPEVEEVSETSYEKGDTPDAKPPEPAPQPPPKSPSPQPPPVSNARLEEPEPSSSSSESREPSPVPAASRRATVEPEETAQEQANLASLMSRLSSLQRVKPKPQPKKERPPVERTPKASRPKPEKPPPPPAQLKPAKVAKPAKPVKQQKPPPKPKPEPKEKKIVPKPAPKPPPPARTPRTPRTLVVEEEPVEKPEPLPISPPEEEKPEPVVEVQQPPPEPSPPPPPTRAPVKKKEKLPPPPPRRRTPTPPPKPPTPQFERKERDDCISGTDSDEEKEKPEEKEEPVTLDLPTLPPALPELNKPLSARSGAGRGNRATMAVPLVAIKTKPRWGQKQRDTTLTDEEERERLAEERRKRHQDMMNRHKAAKAGYRDHANHDGPNFDDYGFLSKYCIMTPSATDKYRYTFDHMDEGGKGYLTEEETAYGLRAINPSLSTSERTYLFRVLEIAGHKMSRGTDFKLFSILAALSQRVLKLDEWARNMMAELDYKHLERKLFLCKTLWECNVDEDTHTITLDQLIVELRAGGVSPQHEQEVRKKLANLRSLDFFDFLMYVPLFITIHESVVSDPLSDSRSF